MEGRGNLILKAVTGGKHHKSSLVFHLHTPDHPFQYISNGLNSQTINLRYVK